MICRRPSFSSASTSPRSRLIGRPWGPTRACSGRSVEPLALELAPAAFFFGLAKLSVGLAASEYGTVLRGPTLVVGALFRLAEPVQIDDRSHRLGSPIRNRAR